MPTEDFFPPRPPSPFVGRDNELEWLRRATDSREMAYSRGPISVIGVAGIGKTALVAEFLERDRLQIDTRWFNCRDWAKEKPDFESVIDDTRERRVGREGLTIVFDGVNDIEERAFRELYGGVRNYKFVRRVIVTSRSPINVRGQSTLTLAGLSLTDTETLVKSTISLSGLDDTSVLKLMGAVNGSPLASTLMAQMAREMSSEQLQRVLSGDLYNFAESLEINNRRFATLAKPIVISTSERIIKRLQQSPTDVHQLTSRQYEEIIAELFRDMGHEVTLTQATRDGGSDIIVSMKNEIGDFLCLVDAKKYRADRKIGVSMVRTLQGTLTDSPATSAMLVTTSSYSRDARAMQERHKYKLSLRDYTDVATWIQKYGSR